MAKDRNVTFFSAAFFYLGKKRPQKYDDVHEFSDSDVALISFIQNFFIRIIFLYFQMLHYKSSYVDIKLNRNKFENIPFLAYTIMIIIQKQLLVLGIFY